MLKCACSCNYHLASNWFYISFGFYCKVWRRSLRRWRKCYLDHIFTSSITDSIFLLDFIVKFKKEVSEAGGHVMSIILLSCFPFDVPFTIISLTNFLFSPLVYAGPFIKEKTAFEGGECMKDVGLHSSLIYITVLVSITLETAITHVEKTEKSWFLLVHSVAKTVRWMKKSCLFEFDGMIISNLLQQFQQFL